MSLFELGSHQDTLLTSCNQVIWWWYLVLTVQSPLHCPTCHCVACLVGSDAHLRSQHSRVALTVVCNPALSTATLARSPLMPVLHCCCSLCVFLCIQRHISKIVSFPLSLLFHRLYPSPKIQFLVRPLASHVFFHYSKTDVLSPVL